MRDIGQEAAFGIIGLFSFFPGLLGLNNSLPEFYIALT